MRTWILVLVLVAGCKSDKDTKAQKQAVAAARVVPTVAVASVLAKDHGKPPVLLVVEEAGVRLAAASSWANLDAGSLTITKKSGPLREIYMRVREDFEFERPPSETVAAIDGYLESDVHLDLSTLDEPATQTQDDPPPPEEEELPDDGKDESGGTGTAMALEEGKMGKKETERVEGQYRMQKNSEDPHLARQQAIEQARAAGILGSSAAKAGPGVGRPNEDGTPSRLAEVHGTVDEDGKLEPLRTMIFIAPTARATKLIEVVRATDGAIAVSHGGKIRPLRLQFIPGDSGVPTRSWLEARVSAKGLVIEAVPDVPIEVADLTSLAAALEKARTTRGADPKAPVDILVDADVDVQRLIDVIVALDGAGVRGIGLGSAPNAAELARRGRRIPTFAIGQPLAMGDLDKSAIRRVVREAKPKLLECYTKALAKNPDLEGTVSTQFLIMPTGKVQSASATGVDPEVATCVAGVVKRLEFPKPATGDVQVDYPFTLRP